MVLAPGRDRLLLGGCLRRGARDDGMARHARRDGDGGDELDPARRADRRRVRRRGQSNGRRRRAASEELDRKSGGEGKSVSGSVDLGGGRIIKTKTDY